MHWITMNPIFKECVLIDLKTKTLQQFAGKTAYLV